jgi:hypothetical protein
MKSANRQGSESVAANIDNYSGSANNLAQMIKGGFVRNGKQVNTSIDKIIIIRAGNKYV